MGKHRGWSGSQLWQTPKKFYDILNKEFKFDFDPCPFEAEFDGCQIEWGKSNFVNPPYDQETKEKFIRKAYAESLKGKLCVLILPVSTSTKIFHSMIYPHASEIRFVQGRINFDGINSLGKRVTNRCGMHDSMVVIFGGRIPDETYRRTVRSK